MPKKAFVAKDIAFEDVIKQYEECKESDKGRGKRAQLTFLALSPQALAEAFRRVTSEQIKAGPKTCITTTRSTKTSDRINNYAQLTFKFVAQGHPSNPGANKGKKKSNSFALSLLCHHIVMLHKQKGKVWPQQDGNGERLVVSHDCHNSFCVKASHLSLVPESSNLQKSNRNCIAWAICRECKVSMLLCKDEPRCRTYVHTICSKCGGGEYQDSATVEREGINMNPYEELSEVVDSQVVQTTTTAATTTTMTSNKKRQSKSDEKDDGDDSDFVPFKKTQKTSEKN